MNIDDDAGWFFVFFLQANGSQFLSYSWIPGEMVSEAPTVCFNKLKKEKRDTKKVRENSSAQG